MKIGEGRENFSGEKLFPPFPPPILLFIPFFSLPITLQLAAGGFDVLPLAFAEDGGDAFGPEDFFEREDVRLGGSLVELSLRGVVGDEVELALDPGNELGELAGVLGLIVYAAEQEILEGDVLARLERIAFQRRHVILARRS